MNEYFLIDLFTSDGVELKEIRRKCEERGHRKKPQAEGRKEEWGQHRKPTPLQSDDFDTKIALCTHKKDKYT